MRFEWEEIDQYHQRAKVFGGWLVKATEDVIHNTEWQGMVGGWDWRIAMAFVPDPQHEWAIDAALTDTLTEQTGKQED